MPLRSALPIVALLALFAHGSTHVAANDGVPRGQARRHSTRHTSAFGGEYTLHRFRIPLAEVEVDLVGDRMSRDVDDVVREHGAIVGINAGFFDLRGAPEGLSYARGRLHAPQSTALGGGIVTIRDGLAELHDAEQPVVTDGADVGLQCRPRLVVDGDVNIRRETGQAAARTALCLREGGRLLELYVARGRDDGDDAGPTLRELATLMRREGCEQALNLDGGPSTGVAWREGRHIRSVKPRSAVRQFVVFKPRSGERHQGTER